MGVVFGSDCALEIARARRRLSGNLQPGVEEQVSIASSRDRFGSVRPAAFWTSVAFLLLAIVQTQDLLIADRVLVPSLAGQFAVLSTLGGVSAFATYTIPLVLLPRASAEGNGAFFPAIGLAGLLGGLGVLVTAVAPRLIVTTIFGSKYSGVAGDATLYMLAMGLLGVGRVLVTQCCTHHLDRWICLVVAASAALQATLIVSFGHDVRSVALSTLTATTFLSVSTAAILMLPSGRSSRSKARLPGLVPAGHASSIAFHPDLSAASAGSAASNGSPGPMS